MKTRGTRDVRHRPPIRSIVGYAYEAPIRDHRYDASDTPEIEKLLERAQRDRVITQFDTGRGLLLWFNGAPGKALRKLRERIRLLLPSNWIVSKRIER